jgi:hypothetical protein
MRRLFALFVATSGAMLVFGSTTSACGGSGDNFNDNDGGPGPGNDGGPNYGDVPILPGFDGSNPGQEGGVACPAGLQCNVSCPGGGTTTISGKVFDPAGKDPLYNITVYVPAGPLQALPKGVPTGADSCDCNALFKSGAVVQAATAVDGTFHITNAPVGALQVVAQVGKWRKVVNLTTTACTDNKLTANMNLPGTVAAGSMDSMPDIAVSTGSADTLECLMKRIGIPDSEYVAGTSNAGHVHVFSGGTNNPPVNGAGSPERHVMPGAPASDTGLWTSQQSLMAYDIVLLSCEGDETFDAKPANLEAYLNAGGRAFGSHFHYAWFGGPINTMQGYNAPADWGNNLATWTAGGGGSGGPIGGIIDTTLNVGGGTFAKGVALQQWLMMLNALGQGVPPVPAGELSIYDPRFDALMTSTNTPSQPWITADQAAGNATANTMYFSFDTPVNAPKPADGGVPNYCGRAVFSGLHVGSNSPDTCNHGTGQPPPAGCGAADLSPQEKALEFMLFDLSACVLPDTVAPPDGGIIIR